MVQHYPLPCQRQQICFCSTYSRTNVHYYQWSQVSPVDAENLFIQKEIWTNYAFLFRLGGPHQHLGDAGMEITKLSDLSLGQVQKNLSVDFFTCSMEK